MRELIENVDCEGLRSLLARHPGLANEGIPHDSVNTTKAHPLHRICDGVFEKKYTDEEAVEMAGIFLDFGSDVNGCELNEEQDTPLIAAASLHAEKVGLLYIDRGANIFHAGCHGGTALHWAAWCGRDKLVERLIIEKAEINRLCIAFRSTPLFWAIHGLKYGGDQNSHNQVVCAELLIKAGADKSIPNFEGYLPSELLGDMDGELIKLLR